MKYCNRTTLFECALFAAVSLLNSTEVSNAFDDLCSVTIERDVVELLEDRYPGWAVLTNDDLLQDDQDIWDNYHGPDKCAGVVRGVFSPPLEETYALLLVRHQENGISSQIILFSNNGLNWNDTIMYREDSIVNAPVIHKGEPGTYRDFYDRSQTIESNFSTLIYEHIESSATAFIYIDGKIRQIWISD